MVHSGDQWGCCLETSNNQQPKYTVGAQKERAEADLGVPGVQMIINSRERTQASTYQVTQLGSGLHLRWQSRV